MRLQTLFCILLIASIASAQAAQSGSEPAKTPAGTTDAQSATPAAKPADSGPAVDEAKVTGSMFRSAYFKFTYELPKDWKALDDTLRVASNKQLQEGEGASRPAARKRSTAAQAASAPASKPVAPPQRPMENFSLLVASPSGVPSIDSVVLPRVNIWAKRRIPPLDHIEDPALFMTSMRYAKILNKPEHVTFDGHDFVRADIETPNGDYRSQFVTIVGDYLIGFEFQAESQQDRALGVDSMKTVKFQ